MKFGGGSAGIVSFVETRYCHFIRAVPPWKMNPPVLALDGVGHDRFVAKWHARLKALTVGTLALRIHLRFAHRIR